RPGHGYYYELVDLETARTPPRIILAYEMNAASVPVERGAPIRLRVEHQLGYKMPKWVNRIELVEDFRRIGGPRGLARRRPPLLPLCRYLTRADGMRRHN